VKAIPSGFFDPVARNAEKEATRADDARRVKSGELTLEQQARRNAFVPYTIDLSRWKLVHDSIADGDDGLP
jgi:hypothetical protein